MLELEAELSLILAPHFLPMSLHLAPCSAVWRGSGGHSPYSCDSSGHPSVRRKEDGLQQSGLGLCW